MLADPLCRLDFCLGTDGAGAFITTSSERAKDLKQKPVYIHGCAHGGRREWGRAFARLGSPGGNLPSACHKPIPERPGRPAGRTAKGIAGAVLHARSPPMVLTELVDYGLWRRGGGGEFGGSGPSRYGTGSIPVNTHGGQLSEAYIIGMTHVREGVEQ